MLVLTDPNPPLNLWKQCSGWSGNNLKLGISIKTKKNGQSIVCHNDIWICLLHFCSQWEFLCLEVCWKERFIQPSWNYSLWIMRVSLLLSVWPFSEVRCGLMDVSSEVEFGEPCSKSSRVRYIRLCANTVGKVMTTSLLPSGMDWTTALIGFRVLVIN